MKPPANNILAEATAKVTVATRRAMIAEKSLKQTKTRYKAAKKALKRARKSAKKSARATRKALRELKELQKQAAHAAKAKRPPAGKKPPGGKARPAKRRTLRRVVTKKVVPAPELAASNSPMAV